MRRNLTYLIIIIFVAVLLFSIFLLVISLYVLFSRNIEEKEDTRITHKVQYQTFDTSSNDITHGFAYIAEDFNEKGYIQYISEEFEEGNIFTLFTPLRKEGEFMFDCSGSCFCVEDEGKKKYTRHLNNMKLSGTSDSLEEMEKYSTDVLKERCQQTLTEGTCQNSSPVQAEAFCEILPEPDLKKFRCGGDCVTKHVQYLTEEDPFNCESMGLQGFVKAETKYDAQRGFREQVLDNFCYENTGVEGTRKGNCEASFADCDELRDDLFKGVG